MAKISIALALLSSCIEKSGNHSSSSENERPAIQNKYRYEFAEGSADGRQTCTTGIRQFENLAELCIGLQDSRLNVYCAEDLREEYFKGVCPNQKFEPFDSGSA
jgi:hypothetical protein